MNSTNYHKQNGVFCRKALTLAGDFEQSYVSVRAQEQRLYPDAVLRQLPQLPHTHAAGKEWQIRKQSSRNLLRYCYRQQARQILEIGCGNGWLSHQFSTLPQAEVIGMDINFTELQQAARVFAKPNLSFVYDVFTANFLPYRQFDVIVFAASIQYFPSLHGILPVALQKLAPGGSLHITDTYFYASAAAQQQAIHNTKDYYHQLGHPHMSNYYHHHTLADLQPYHYQVKQHAPTWLRRLKKQTTAFPWIIITP